MHTKPIADMTNQEILIELCQNHMKLEAANAAKSLLGHSPNWGDCREEAVFTACQREIFSRMRSVLADRGRDMILDALCRAFQKMTDVEAACRRFDVDYGLHSEPREEWEGYLRTAVKLMAA